MPAITATPSTSDGETRLTCTSCLGLLAEVALKCKSCLGHVHLRCSGLNEYHLVRFAVTQATYVCAACVKTKDMTQKKYEEEHTKVLETMAKEVSLLEQVRKDADFTITGDTSIVLAGDSPNSATAGESPSGATQQKSRDVGSGSVGNNETAQTEPRKNNAICKYFKTKSCKHGAKGNGCPFRHPPKCLKFLKHGSKTSRGCQKGNQCERFHPKLCYSSVNNGWCDRKNCSFHHIQGTRGYNNNNNTEIVQPRLYSRVTSAQTTLRPPNVSAKYNLSNQNQGNSRYSR